MNTLKTKLFGAVLAMAFLMSFTLMPADYDPIEIKKNGEWIDAGMEYIDGKWYFVDQCVKSDVVKCVIGTKKYKPAGIKNVPFG